MKGDEMGGACRMRSTDYRRICTMLYLQNLTWKDTGVYEKVNLNRWSRNSVWGYEWMGQ